MSDIEFALRVATGALCGMLVGFERARDHKNTGMRTLGLVGLGGALLMAAVESATSGDVDATSRVLQGVMAGIGFLGAGVILHGGSDQHARGMTTAAAIWVTAILGMLAGMGLIGPAIAATVIVFALLFVGRGIDRAVTRRFGSEPDDDEGS